MITSVTTGVIGFLYHGEEKNRDYKLNEPSRKALALFVLYVHE